MLASLTLAQLRCLIRVGFTDLVYISLRLINDASETPSILLPSRVFARTLCIHL
jgi:hypothetical protein